MSPIEQTALAHYVWMAGINKAAAWQLCNEAAQRCEMLQDLPRLLTEAMHETRLRDGTGPKQRAAGG
jgi:hypothetical protein